MRTERHVVISRLGLLVAFCLIAVAASIVMDVDRLEAQTTGTTGTRGTVRQKLNIPPSARAKISGIFMGWDVGRHGKEPTVSIKFIPTGRSTKAKINTPSITPNFRGIVHDSIALRVAKRLKLGGKVEIEYASYFGRVWMLELARPGYSPEPEAAETREEGKESSTADTPQVPVDRFVYVGAKKVRTSGGIRMHVVARKGSNMWKFHAPFESGQAIRNSRPAGKNDGIDADNAESDKPKTLSKQASEFKAGDVVAIKYDTNTDAINFTFILAGIRPYMMSGAGTVTRTGSRIMRAKKYDVGYIKDGKINRVLVVPRKARDGQRTDVKELTAKLKSLKGAEAVFTYCKLGGVLWLDSISAK